MRFHPLAALIFGLGFASMLTSASCSGTCASGQNCDSGAANAGAAGSASSTCAQLTALRACFDPFCKTAQNPFCSCYSGGNFLNTDTCACMAFDPSTFCRNNEASGVPASTYADCSATTGAVATACVGVQ